ncbi:MAG: Fe-S cluster assembly protein SufD [Alphaproteobacteria bacterium]
MSVAAIIAQSKSRREAWKYTALTPLAGIEFMPALHGAAISGMAVPSALPAGGRHRLVFVNGALSAEWSRRDGLPADIVTGDPLEGYDLRVEAQTCLIAAPLEVVFIAAKDAHARQSMAKLRVTLGASARLTLIEHHAGFGAGAAHAAVTEVSVALGAQAKLLHAKFQDMGAEDYHLAATKVDVEGGAYYDRFAMTTGAALSRDEVHVTLKAPLAQTQLHGVYLQRGAQHADTTTVIDHAAPHTSSREVYKGVLDGKSRGVFQGRITVRPGAQKTDGHQLSRVLLLSDQAEADAKPELEIYADDVKCSHGATIGQLDETALFYLRSRGIPEREARALLIQAFAAEIIDGLASEELRAYASARAHEWHGGRP